MSTRQKLTAFLLFFTGLVPVATRDIIPGPDLEESHDLGIAGPVLDPVNQNLVRDPANPVPVQPIGNPSLVPRAVLR